MNNRIKIIIFIVISFVVGVLIIHNYTLYIEKKDYETIDYDYQSKSVKEVYELHPDKFIFDYNGVCKITVEKIHTIGDDYGFEIEHDKYGNMCLGYFIIKKTGNVIDVNASHICDMINY